MNTVLVIGSGGREHALAACFKRSPSVSKVYVAPGNPGMRDVADIVDISASDFEGLADFAIKQKVTLIFVGPEAPLSQGIVDIMSAKDLRIFGPTQAAARLESSKTFAKSVMNKYAIPTAKHVTVHHRQEALHYLVKHPAPIVIKADGLMAGKGVTVAMTDQEAIAAVNDIYSDDTVNSPLVIEECLEGEEFSLMAFVNGETVIPMDIARDHKRAYDHDQGPNTGGMGAYSPVPQISQAQINEAMTTIMRPIAKAMVKEGFPFQGVLYGGLMATKDGIKTIEFNVRFGDPETEVLLPRLLTPLDQCIEAVLDHQDPNLQFDPSFAVGIVMAANGYPKAPEKGHRIDHLERVKGSVYHMGTTYQNGYLSAGGRVLCVVDLGSTLTEAALKAYRDVQQIEAPGLFTRHDIGLKQP